MVREGGPSRNGFKNSDGNCYIAESCKARIHQRIKRGRLNSDCSDTCVHVCDSSGSNTALRLDKYLLRGVSFWRRGHGTFKMMSSATCIKAEWNGPGRKRVMSTENRGSVNSSTRGG